MSGGGGGGGLLHDSFLCENESWDFSNSENSAGDKDKLSGKKARGSTSNSQTEMGMEEAAPPSKKKRAGRGGVRKNVEGMIIGDKGKEEGKGAGESDHEIHIWTERERRKKMRNMFTNLHALLPHLHPKVRLLLFLRECIKGHGYILFFAWRVSLCLSLAIYLAILLYYIFINRKCPFFIENFLLIFKHIDQALHFFIFCLHGVRS